MPPRPKRVNADGNASSKPAGHRARGKTGNVGRLGHHGLISHLPRRGSYVPTIDEDDALRSYELRAPMEQHAAAQFCAHADDSALTTLALAVDTMRCAANDEDIFSFVDADITFHRTVWEASGHPLLPRMWPLFESTMRTLIPTTNRLFIRHSLMPPRVMSRCWKHCGIEMPPPPRSCSTIIPWQHADGYSPTEPMPRTDVKTDLRTAASSTEDSPAIPFSYLLIRAR